MRIRIPYILSIFILALSACKKSPESIDVDQNKLVFASTIEGQIQTRASGASWDTNDSIGLFMYTNGAPLTTSSVIGDGFNKKYITRGNGNFAPAQASQELILPAQGQVNFTAIYPYKQTALVNDLNYPMDISDQRVPAAIDYLYATNTTGATSGQNLVSLAFSRPMTKIALRVSGDGHTGVQSTLSNTPTTAAFNLSTGTLQVNSSSTKSLTAKIISTAADQTVVEWILFPGKLPTSSKITFTLSSGKTHTWDIGSIGTDYVKGNRYEYNITLKGGDIITNPTASYMELPVITTGPDIRYNMTHSLSTRRNFSMLYDTKYKIAYWVAYPLNSSYINGNGGRTDDWAYDPAFSSNFQANLSSGYPNNSSLLIDRGHQIPSGDRVANNQENRATFYYTNMTPQNRNLNQNKWANLENKVRSWATLSNTDTLYVVTGAMITTDTDKNIDYVKDNSNRDVAKPKYYYKALAMKQGTRYYTIAFKMDNVSQSNTNYLSDTLSVTKLETMTGFTFFPALDRTTKSTVNAQIWR